MMELGFLCVRVMEVGSLEVLEVLEALGLGL